MGYYQIDGVYVTGSKHAKILEHFDQEAPVIDTSKNSGSTDDAKKRVLLMSYCVDSPNNRGMAVYGLGVHEGPGVTMTASVSVPEGMSVTFTHFRPDVPAHTVYGPQLGLCLSDAWRFQVKSIVVREGVGGTQASGAVISVNPPALSDPDKRAGKFAFIWYTKAFGRDAPGALQLGPGIYTGDQHAFLNRIEALSLPPGVVLKVWLDRQGGGFANPLGQAKLQQSDPDFVLEGPAWLPLHEKTQPEFEFIHKNIKMLDVSFDQGLADTNARKEWERNQIFEMHRELTQMNLQFVVLWDDCVTDASTYHLVTGVALANQETHDGEPRFRALYIPAGFKAEIWVASEWGTGNFPDRIEQGPLFVSCFDTEPEWQRFAGRVVRVRASRLG